MIVLCFLYRMEILNICVMARRFNEELAGEVKSTFLQYMSG